MSLLLDTHFLLWAAQGAEFLPDAVRGLIADPAQPIAFSVVSIWEVAIKNSLAKPDFHANPDRLRGGLLRIGFRELDITANHAVAVGRLPWLHRDPFDRMLIAQAIIEGTTLLTVDRQIGRYPGPIRLIT